MPRYSKPIEQLPTASVAKSNRSKSSQSQSQSSQSQSQSQSNSNSNNPIPINGNKFLGGCHCGSIRFSVELTADNYNSIIDCNCSICTKKGILHLIVHRNQFKLLPTANTAVNTAATATGSTIDPDTGNNAIIVYQFNTTTARHYFCRYCGIHPYYIPRSNPADIDINIHCLDQYQSIKSLFTIKSFDGTHWEQNINQITDDTDIIEAAAAAAVVPNKSKSITKNNNKRPVLTSAAATTAVESAPVSHSKSILATNTAVPISAARPSRAQIKAQSKPLIESKPDSTSQTESQSEFTFRSQTIEADADAVAEFIEPTVVQNLPKKRKSTTSTPSIASSSVESIDSTHNRRKSLFNQQSNSNQPQSQSSASISVPSAAVTSNPIIICVTGYKFNPSQHQLLMNLFPAIKFTETAATATHLVTDKVRRTDKFLSGYSHSQYIVNYQWLLDSLRLKSLQSELNYLLTDPAAEQQYEFKLSQRQIGINFLLGKQIYCTDSVQPNQSTISAIIQSVGGILITDKPTDYSYNIIIISTEIDRIQSKSLLLLGYTIYSSELILTGILRQKLELDQFIIDQPKSNNNRISARSISTIKRSISTANNNSVAAAAVLVSPSPDKLRRYGKRNRLD